VSRLVLIKHASPLVVPDVSSEQWRLSDKGRASCIPLAEQLRQYAPKLIVSSTEPKAVETAELIAAHLAIPHETAPHLHEHDRSNVPHMRSSDFISAVELFFRKPDQLVLGHETAQQAEQRFSRAVRNVLIEHPNDDIAIVSHGTVIALLLARHSDRTGFQLWRELGLPSFAVLETPAFKVAQIVAKVQA
jgi:broad specificity phosphatase PhoE